MKRLCLLGIFLVASVECINPVRALAVLAGGPATVVLFVAMLKKKQQMDSQKWQKQQREAEERRREFEKDRIFWERDSAGKLWLRREPYEPAGAAMRRAATEVHSDREGNTFLVQPGDPRWGRRNK